ncbi:glycosyltransferase [Desulfovibrio inopinatus]|uniref:glycosyltransferase n=1 Tax=Desulfovibrio inopinatus TaxID=102109 RepID=UPI0003FFC9E4|nr:glycosyltransferase [Desulfovibrio inopinatus]
MSNTEKITQGLVERITSGRVEGHVRRTDNDNVQLTVELWCGDKQISSAPANIDRQDVSTVPHGFSLPITELDFLYLSFGNLEVRVVGTNETVPFAEAIAPAHLREILQTRGFIGSLHTHQDMHISGIAVSLKHPENPTDILVVDENKKIIDTITCSIRTRHPLPPGVTKKIGFDCDLPESLIDGQEHTITLVERYSQRPLPGSPIRVNGLLGGQGVVDQVDTLVVSGWARSFAAQNRATVVDVYVGDELLGSAETSIYRPDVLELVGGSGFYGFDVKLDRPLMATEAPRFKVLLRDTSTVLELTPEASNQLKTLGMNDDNTPIVGEYKGHLDKPSGRSIGGWAAKTDETERPQVVDIFINLFYTGSVVCDILRTDVGKSLGSKGYHGFHYEIPPQFCHSKSILITARFRETGSQLPGSPLVAYFGPPGLPLSEVEKGHGVVTAESTRTGQTASSTDSAEQLPKIGLIVLNQNGEDYLEDFFQSFARVNTYPNFEILIVDHGSDDLSQEISERYGQSLPVRFLNRRHNYSFSASNNYGVKFTDAEFLFIINNDIIFRDDILGPLAQHLHDPDVAAVGLRLLTPDFGGLDENIKVGRSLGFALIDEEPSQHVSVKFSFCNPHKPFIPFELPLHTTGGAEKLTQEPCLTAAALMVRKSDYLAVGGFEERYFYGYEDVDLCLKLQTALNKSLVSAHTLTAYHHRSASRSLLNEDMKKRISKNFGLLQNRFGYYLLDKNRKERLDGDLFFRHAPLRLAFLVSATELSGAKADFFTALELGQALQEEYGWEIHFLEPNQWYNLEHFDVAIALLHTFNPLKIKREQSNPNLLVIAWARNWFDAWLEKPELNEFDQVWAGSDAASKALSSRLGVPVPVIRIAANIDRFANGISNPDLASDYCFTGSFFRAPRQMLTVLDPSNLPYTFKVFGHNWEEVPHFVKYHAGAVNYPDMPAIYHSTKLVIDDANHTTVNWGSVNSRVFDALAAGTLVVTNGRLGAQEAFDGLLPSYETREELEDIIEYYLEHEEKRLELVTSLHRIVKERHSYVNRAHEIKAAIHALQIENFRVRIHCLMSPHQPDPLIEATAEATAELFGKSGSHAWLKRQSARVIQDEAAVLVCRDLRGVALEPDFIDPTRINVLIDLGGKKSYPFEEAALFDVVITISDADSLSQNLAPHGDAVVVGLGLSDDPIQPQDMTAVRMAIEQAFPRLVEMMHDRRTAIGQGTLFKRGTQISAEADMSETVLPQTRVVFFPNYTVTNPYQNLLYTDLPEGFTAEPGTIAAARNAAERGESIVFHLHWSAVITGNVPSRLEAENRIKAFFEDLEGFLEAGGTLALTIHNVLPHEANHPDLEIEVCHRLFARAHVIHAHSHAALAEAEHAYPVPIDSVFVAHHGNYIDVYPNTMGRDEARRKLELDQSALVFLFFGQIRGYKGLDELVEAFSQTVGSQNTAFLIIAGKPVGIDENNIIELAQRYPNIGLVLDYIPDDEIQVFFNAADFVVLPYKKVLTSGSIYLALSYGVPVIAPARGLLSEVLTGPLKPFLYNPDTPNGLAQALLLANKSKESLPELRRAALDKAREYDWPSTRQALVDAIIRARYGKMHDVVVGETTRSCLIRYPEGLERQPRVAVAVLHYEHTDDTIRCVRALGNQTLADHDVYIVSNDDNLLAFNTLCHTFEDATVIQSPENIGYAAGNNIALALINEKPYDYVLILNPDCVAPPTFLASLTASADAHPDASIFGPLILFGDKPDVIWFGGGILDMSDGFSAAHHLIGKRVHQAPNAPFETDYITGAALFFRKSVIGDVGYIPEEFFLYFEETSWCLEAKAKGHRLLMLPGIHLFHHKRSEDGGLPTPTFLYYYTRNCLIMTARHTPDHMESSLVRHKQKINAWLTRIKETGDAERLETAQKAIELGIRDGRDQVTGKIDLQSMLG